ncbi:GNAT family N-acetyltransferase [Algicola sagamiensis]|uniref:GNAT family N-acetyltransferase n=1 Tax=Algicola sagamiensis TaxID=163869 RepID=UPI00037CA6A1|nr:GNAT family N-acetyltransferase [Algicola sagamiensis]
MNWQCLPFSQLTTHQLYDLLKLRVDVFIVEQDCPFSDLDNRDQLTSVYHLCGYEQDKLVAYARLMPPGSVFEKASIGRVVTSPDARGSGAGQALMREAIRQCELFWPGVDIEIAAQEYLLNFYQSFGFEAFTDVYLEDGIPHVDMRLHQS